MNEEYKNFAGEFKGVEDIITPAELKNLFSYINDMEINMKRLNGELEAIKSRFEQPIVENRQKIKEVLQIDFTKLKKDVEQELQELIQDFKGSILEKAEDIRTCVHEKNLEGLNAILDKLNIKEFCEKILKALDAALEKTRHAEKRVEYVEKQLGEAKGHLNNAQNPEMLLVDTADKVEFRVIKNSIRAQSRLLSNVQEKTETFRNQLVAMDKDVKNNKLVDMEKQREAVCKTVRLKDRSAPILNMQRG